jgi:thiol-disulfide isomerase/thioredoxin
MKKNIIFLLPLITALLFTASFAEVETETPLNNFGTDSYKTIVTRYQGHSFLMVLWSVDCLPCIEELPALEKFHRENPKANLIMISTDSKNQQEDIAGLMNKHGLSDIQQWVFDGNFAQATRFSIDPLWYGELPRSYFHYEKIKRMAKTGRLDADALSSWVTLINNTTAGL